jgi:WD40 repeat protein
MPVKVYNALEKAWHPCIVTIDGHSDVVKSVAISPDGTRIASGSYDNTVRLWDTVSCARLSTLTLDLTQIERVAFSPDGTRVASLLDNSTCGTPSVV